MCLLLSKPIRSPPKLTTSPTVIAWWSSQFRRHCISSNISGLKLCPCELTINFVTLMKKKQRTKRTTPRKERKLQSRLQTKLPVIWQRLRKTGTGHLNDIIQREWTMTHKRWSSCLQEEGQRRILVKVLRLQSIRWLNMGELIAWIYISYINIRNMSPPVSVRAFVECCSRYTQGFAEVTMSEGMLLNVGTCGLRAGWVLIVSVVR